MNPQFNSQVDGQSAGVVNQNPLNNPDFNSRQGLNTYSLPYQNLVTARYGEITPFCYFSSIGRDRITLNSSHELRSYTLSAPLMSSLRMYKSNFSVPLAAMMPNTYDYLFVNPLKGDDVPDDAYCWIDLIALFRSLIAPYSSYTKDSVKSDLAGVLKIVLLVHCIFSRGSLLDYLGITSANVIETDGLIDSLMSCFGPSNTSDRAYMSINYNMGTESHPLGYIASTSSDFRKNVDILYSIIEHPDCTVDIVDSSDVLANNLFLFLDFFKTVTSQLNVVKAKLIVNLYKVIAYQMICAQFYSNDSVDDIYTADLWLSNMKSLQYSFAEYFSLNGIKVLYDVFSNHNLEIMLAGNSTSAIQNRMYFFYNLFTFRRSLRYGDYFTGSRTSPLAVGDVNVPVVGNNVSVIDINKNLHIQRFLNAVNRVGSDIISYARGIFGYTPTAVKPAPSFISTESEYIGGDEIDNTGTQQGTVNLNLRSNGNRYMYDVNITDECVILSLCSFEVTGCYGDSIERDNFHVDRFDSFIPELQHVGDQSVYRSELYSKPTEDIQTYGYQTRYAEYKYKYNQAHGGFTYNLPHWAHIYDASRFSVLSSDSIRSYPYEFDGYYKTLMYGSLAGYFHFQISFVNDVKANRPIQMYPNLV